MKAISVKQPWAYMLVDGAKTVEVRSWPTTHRGPLLICAAAAPHNCFWDDGEEKRLLHAGCMIGVVDVLDCRKMTKADDDASLGNYKAGMYAWVTKPVGFCQPIAIKQKLNLFDVPDGRILMLHEDIDVEWLFDYPHPQGEVKLTARCPIIG